MKKKKKNIKFKNWLLIFLIYVRTIHERTVFILVRYTHRRIGSVDLRDGLKERSCSRPEQTHSTKSTQQRIHFSCQIIRRQLTPIHSISRNLYAYTFHIFIVRFIDSPLSTTPEIQRTDPKIRISAYYRTETIMEVSGKVAPYHTSWVVMECLRFLYILVEQIIGQQ